MDIVHIFEIVNCRFLMLLRIGSYHKDNYLSHHSMQFWDIVKSSWEKENWYALAIYTK